MPSRPYQSVITDPTKRQKVIRAASSDLSALTLLEDDCDTSDLLAIADQNVGLHNELENFHPHLVRHAREIAEGEKLQPKTIRKTNRGLASIIVRSASRSTPSRLLSTVGNLHPGDEPVMLDDTGFVVAAVQMGNLDPGETTTTMLRWNPSIVIHGEWGYLTAPRGNNVAQNSSFKRNRVVDRLRELTLRSAKSDDVVATIGREFEAPTDIVQGLVDQFLEREFLLTESDESYSNFRSSRQVWRQDISFVNPVQVGIPADHDDVDLYRSASGSINGLDGLLCEYLDFALEAGIFDYADAGISSVFSDMFIEKFGMTRVAVVDLIHPVHGLDLETIRSSPSAQAAVKQEVPPLQRAVYERCAVEGKRWVDIRACGAELPKNQRNYHGFSSVDVIASIHGETGRETFNLADAISNVHGGITTARFDCLQSTTDVQPAQFVNIDWVSPDDAFNAVRESESSGDRTLNVNAFGALDSELTISDLVVWSDGREMHVADTEGNPIELRPRSMVGVASYPSWLFEIFLLSNTQLPNINWSWGDLSNHVNYTPGVRYGSLILARPAFRYQGEVDWETFNSWADERSISTWIRIGDADRKLLLNRRAPGYRELLEFQLRRSDRWVYESFEEELSSPVTGSDGKQYFSEIVSSIEVQGPNSEDDEDRQRVLKAKASTLPLYVPDEARFITPSGSSTVNLTVVPADGFEAKTLAKVMGALSADPTSYFVRYPLGSRRSVRFRFSKEAEQAPISQTISDLVRDGWVREIQETPHNLEIERYGGLNSFRAFIPLWRIESEIAAALSSTDAKEGISSSLRLPLMSWWLGLFPNMKNSVLAFANQSQVADTEFANKASNLLKQAREQDFQVIAEENLQRWLEPAAAFANHIDQLELDPYVLQSAAHMFANRLGIGNDEEGLIWRVLKDLNDEES